MLRSPINYKTLFWHYSYFVKHDIFLNYLVKLGDIILIHECSLLIDSTIIYNKYGVTILMDFHYLFCL
jgi:hypothetical protein